MPCWARTETMGIGFVLLIWAAAGLALAGVGAVLLGGMAAYLTRDTVGSRKSLIVAASLFPFLCLAWAGGVFVFQAVVNEIVFHRDPGLGDSWNCRLPDGYAILMIDVTDQGWVYNPKTQPGDSVTDGEDAIAGVRTLQVAGRYILGGSDTRSFEDQEKQRERVDSYFLLDTEIGKQTKFPSYEALREKAQDLGIVAKLEPIESVYSRYRFGWFDVLAIALSVTAPLIGALFLLRWTLRVRKSR
jgi:hypothetical protein